MNEELVTVEILLCTIISNKDLLQEILDIRDANRSRLCVSVCVCVCTVGYYIPCMYLLSSFNVTTNH